MHPLWTGQTGGLIDWPSPAVVDDEVYVGSADGYLYAYKVGCGKDGATCSRCGGQSANPTLTFLSGPCCCKDLLLLVARRQVVTDPFVAVDACLVACSHAFPVVLLGGTRILLFQVHRLE